MKFLLTSAGLSTLVIKNKFLNLIGKNPNDISLVFIATAPDLEENKNYVDKDKKIFSGMGVKIKELDLKNKTEELLKAELKDIDAVFVEGGNTFYLLYWVHKSGFDKVLKEFLDRGGVYVGASAGSILVSPSIETCGWKGGDRAGVVKLDNLDGLKFVNFSIYPHFEEDQKEFVTEKSSSLSYVAQVVLARLGQGHSLA